MKNLIFVAMLRCSQKTTVEATMLLGEDPCGFALLGNLNFSRQV